MKKFIAARILVFLTLAISLTPVASADLAQDLAQYVNVDDGAYKWEKISQNDFKDGSVIYELKLTSQVWQGITWQHTLQIIKPKRIQKTPTLVLLLVVGSGKGEKELRYGELISNRIEAPVAILHDVPNQPLFGGLKEDDLIAYTFAKFLEMNDNTWPLLLPMTKSVVKAMDAVEEFMEGKLNIPVSGFVVTGASKRGWTTWLTPVVDKRVKAIVPMVYDNLNLLKQMRHQLETWGQFSEEISAYTDRGIPQRLLSDGKVAHALSAIVDPFSYRKKITVPKLMIIGTNDRYWPLDALNIYYDKLIGEKYIFYVPNVGHGLGAGMNRAVEDITAFFLKTEGRLRFPNLTWKFKEKDGSMKLAVTSDIKPLAIRAWTARSQTKDFRNAKWEPLEMKRKGRIYTYKFENPAEGFEAVFGEATYSEVGRHFFLSTNVKVFQ